MENPFEAYRINPSSPKEPQKETDERRRKEALADLDAAIKKAQENGNKAKAKELLEKKKRIEKYDFGGY